MPNTENFKVLIKNKVGSPEKKNNNKHFKFKETIRKHTKQTNYKGNQPYPIHLLSKHEVLSEHLKKNFYVEIQNWKLNFLNL
jgi:hypothetical protein